MKRLTRVTESVFTRFIAFFLLTITPICIIAIILYNWQIRLLDQTTVAAFETNAHHGFANVEKELTKVKSLSLANLLDEDLLLLSNSSKIMNIYQKTVSVNRYIHRMEALKNSSDYIEKVETYIPDMNRVYDDRGNIQPDAGEILRVFQATKQQAGWHFSVLDNHLYYVFLPPGTTMKTRSFSYLLVVQLSISRIQNELAAIPDAEKAILYDDNHTYVIYARSAAPAHPVDLKSLAGRNPANAPYQVREEGRTAWVVHQDSDYLGLSLAAYLPINELNPRTRELRWYFIVFSMAIIFTVLILTYLTANLIKKPLGSLVRAFGKVEQGNLGVRLEHRSNDEFRYIFRSFNSMVAEIKELLEQVYEQKILAQSAQLKQLQSQINPHFLYNSFFAIGNMARLQDFESIRLFSEYLAQYYQFITKNQSDEIRLAEEVEHSKIYADIQKMRFGDRVHIEFGELPTEAADMRVPRLILQPLVENVFEHGIRRYDEEGMLKVHFYREGSRLIVCVEDNGSVTEDELESIRAGLERPAGEVSGMANIHKRLQLLYGGHCGISVSRSAMGGLKVTMTIGGNEHV